MDRNNPISEPFRFYCSNTSKNSMFCGHVNKHELLKQIEKLHDRKAPGPDNIGNKLVKQAASVLLDTLIHLLELYTCYKNC